MTVCTLIRSSPLSLPFFLLRKRGLVFRVGVGKVSFGVSAVCPVFAPLLDFTRQIKEGPFDGVSFWRPSMFACSRRCRRLLGLSPAVQKSPDLLQSLFRKVLRDPRNEARWALEARGHCPSLFFGLPFSVLIPPTRYLAEKTPSFHFHHGGKGSSHFPSFPSSRIYGKGLLDRLSSFFSLLPSDRFSVQKIGD